MTGGDFDEGTVGPVADDVRHRLLKLIRGGGLRAGQKLGSERELATQFAVSRASLRQALASLEAAGVVRRVPGRGGGTFVGQPKIERDLSSVVGVPALLRRQGIVAGTRIVSTSMQAADDQTAAALGIRPGALVVDLVRIRLADGSPISLEHARLPAQRFPGLLELPLGGSVYELMEERYGIRPVAATESIEVVEAGEDESSILDVAPGVPLLSITRVTTDEEGRPIEFSHDLFRADRTRIVVHSPGGGTARSAQTRGGVVELRAQA